MIELGYMFKHEKQNAYLLALKFISWKTVLFDDCSGLKTADRVIFELMDKGGLSILFYTLQGNEKTVIQEKDSLFAKAVLAAKTSSSCLDALVANGIFDKIRIIPGKKILVAIVALLEDRQSRFKRNANNT